MAEFHIIIVRHGWERFEELLDLSYAVLYGPFGVAREAEWYHPANGSEFAVAIGERGELLGTARLLPGGVSRQVRQVVVAPDAHGRGVGRTLMGALESLAAEEGTTELWLHSRRTAVGFYERLGYVGEGQEFTSKLTGIPHLTMRKPLG